MRGGRIGGGEAEVVPQVTGGGDPQRAGGDAQELAMGVGASSTTAGSTRSGRS